MSLLKRYSLEWKEDPSSRDAPPRGEAPGQRGVCHPLLSPLPPSLSSFLPSSHTSHCQWGLEAKLKTKTKKPQYLLQAIRINLSLNYLPSLSKSYKMI